MTGGEHMGACSCPVDAGTDVVRARGAPPCSEAGVRTCPVPLMNGGEHVGAGSCRPGDAGAAAVAVMSFSMDWMFCHWCRRTASS